jgi:hypothetical protein
MFESQPSATPIQLTEGLSFMLNIKDVKEL